MKNEKEERNMKEHFYGSRIINERYYAIVYHWSSKGKQKVDYRCENGCQTQSEAENVAQDWCFKNKIIAVCE